MIDTDKLRRLAETVQSPAYNINERMGALRTLHDTLPSGVVLELLNRLEAAESDALEQARLNGMGASREAALMAKLEAAEKERDDVAQQLADSERELSKFKKAWRTQRENIKSIAQDRRKITEERDAIQAKVAAMEKQEPVAWCATDETGTVIEALGMNQSRRFDTALYLATGAKGE